EVVLEPNALDQCERVLNALSQAAQQEIMNQGIPAARIQLTQRAHLRYEGTDAALVVGYGSVDEMRQRFEATYQQRYSFLMPDKRLVIEALSVEATGLSGEAANKAGTSSSAEEVPAAQATMALFSGGSIHEQTPVYLRDA